MLSVGDPVPWFVARASNNPNFNFDTIAGRYVVLSFFESASKPYGAALLQAIEQGLDPFDDENVSFFGVTTDPEDEAQGRARQRVPGIRFFWDFDGEVSRQCGVLPPGAGPEGYQAGSIVTDTRLRTIAAFPCTGDPARHVQELFAFVRALPPIAAVQGTAPVLTIPRVFEPEFCRMLIRLYETHGGEDSGFMRDQGGKTVGMYDYSHKKREDYYIEDQPLKGAIQARFHRRIVPEIQRAFQYRVTRMERYLVGCYEAATKGHFNAHRDNTTLGTAHRRFAVTVNLNAEDFQGGELRFPEFGQQTYRAETGGAIVFSCSLLHEATVVTEGKRYAFLPFLYDDEAAKIRETNQQFLAPKPAT